MSVTMVPAALQERVEPGAPVPRDGEVVVYWMRVAVRAVENPALEVALFAGRTLGKPVLVYQCLSTREPFASDRHFTFALEGARDVEQALAARGIAYQREVGDAPFSRELFARAALVVCDFMPVPWLRALDAEAALLAPLWRVDASCLAPVWKLASPVGSFAEFKKANAVEWRLRAATAPLSLGGGAGQGEGKSRSTVPILETPGSIDHSVAPVHHTPGGTTAALARWHAFRDTKLAHYDRDRAVPLREGTSRLSAYFHHGHLSPFTVAREAAAQHTDGARTFLEEFLGWRELAWHFCLHHEHPERLEVLPAWARDSLRAHEREGRTALPSWEQLARAQTGDLLWDAAQRQLLTHGELHNDVRMTWCKALVGWTRSTQEALTLALELNDRYALDGRDPSSFLGVLWCFGLFDRPFPETPYLGAVRARPTQEYARRLDVGEFERRAHRPSRGTPLTVAIIGAGVAGAAAARTLVDAGHVVTLFDRGQVPGGRLATQHEGPLRFDHGAPSFTVRDERFARWARAWWQERVLGQWRATVEGEQREDAADLVRLVGVPGMEAVVKRLLLGLDARFGVEVKGLTRDGARWRLLDAQGHALGEYDVAVVATPAPRAAELIDPSSYALASRIREVVMAPCWAVMAHFAEGSGVEWDALRSQVGPLAWLAKNGSKPERPVLGGESWVWHASGAWSRAHLEADAEEVAPMLLDAFYATTGVRRQVPLVIKPHRWRHALTERPLGEPCLWDEGLQLAVCGDWCLGARVEDAFLSGTAAAGRINALPGGPVESREPPRPPESQLALPLP